MVFRSKNFIIVSFRVRSLIAFRVHGRLSAIGFNTNIAATFRNCALSRATSFRRLCLAARLSARVAAALSRAAAAEQEVGAVGRVGPAGVDDTAARAHQVRQRRRRARRAASQHGVHAVPHTDRRRRIQGPDEGHVGRRQVEHRLARHAPAPAQRQLGPLRSAAVDRQDRRARNAPRRQTAHVICARSCCRWLPRQPKT
jgi:hypothetical protein